MFDRWILGWLCALPLLSSPAAAQTPDLTVSVVGTSNAWTFHGSALGQAAYSFRNTTCNQGTAPLDWSPVLVENLYQVIDGGIRQLGAGFGLHKTCALNGTGCGTCQPTGCSTLGVGCADTSAVNDGAFGWARWQIDGVRGTWTGTPVGPCCEDPILAGRVFAPIADLEDPAGRIIAESLFLSEHDQASGNGANNASWTEMLVPDHRFPSGSGVTHVGEPAIFAWQDRYPDVQIEALVIPDEGGPGIDGHLWLGSRATDLGNGFWRYDYAIQNLTSERGVREFSVASTCPQMSPFQMEFHGVPHHSGSPYDSTPWTPYHLGGVLTWATDSFAQNPNANALRWGTLYSFSFLASDPPGQGTVALGLFQPGTPASITGAAWIPSHVGFEYPAFCTALPTSLGVPMVTTGSGTPVIDNVDLQLTTAPIPLQCIGYYLMADGQGFLPLPAGSQGNLCVGGTLYRLNGPGQVQFSGTTGSVSFHPDPNQLPSGAVWTPGSTWNFQYWSRDNGFPSNFSNLASITFCY
ncbi:MAG: hypothetical protein KDB61_02060 [Planctomycetes bacterium]|nr:hypothetical protein [Planctomycetota bacterium]